MRIKNIVLVEDDSRFSQIMAKMINHEPNLDCIKQFKNATEALELDSRVDVDLFVLDIRLPDISGIELLKKLKKKFDQANFMMCTTFEDSALIVEALKSGAIGYIVKSDSPNEILNAIKLALENKSSLSANVSDQLVKFLNNTEQKNNKIENLTSKEIEVLEMLSRGLLYKEIADIQQVALITVKKHCSNIYLKLNVTNKTEALKIFYNL